MNARHFCPIAVGALCLSLAPSAWAHPITVDGNVSDWSSRKPGFANLGLLVRTAQSTGEFVWVDAKSDARTDLATPEVVADLVAFHVTGSPNGLAFLARRDPAAVFSGKPIQIQIAIDVDRVSGSGQTWFAGFGEASVPAANAWEYLVQTRFGSGQQPIVVDTGFTQSGTGTASSGTAADIEIFVPWSALKLSGPPATALRFSVATFRSETDDRTTDITGSANVVDAVTNYAAPSAGPFPNTWEEVKDGVVDYSFDLWFDSQGELYSPLVIQKFVTNSTTFDEWYAVRNVTGTTLSLASFKLGDEETLDGTGEGMLDFPPTATLAAGEVFVVAIDGAKYEAAFKTSANAEVGSTSASTPDMVKYAPWMGTATNSVNLSTTGDELLIVDPSVNIIDLVAFGNSPLAEVFPYTPAPGNGIVLSRDSSSSDTDSCKVDFSNDGIACTSDADCVGPCKQCVYASCVNKPAGTSCADSDVCNGAETCDASGVCQLGIAKSCEDNEPCTDDFCSPLNGSCSHVPNTASCNDGNACTQNDVCQAGKCVGGTAASCDDTNPCTTDSCDPVSGCQHVANQAVCDDGVFCNGVDTCSAGDCTQHSGDPCAPPDGDENCAESCDEAGDSCTGPDPDGSSCNDGKFCTVTDKCAGGACVGSGDPCPPPDGDENCAESCDETADSCTGPDPDGSSCNDGLFCTQTDSCSAGACLGTGSPCQGADNDDDCSETCNEQADSCDANDPDGAACLNGGTCQAGVCQGGGGSAGAAGSAGSGGSAGAAGNAGTAGSAGAAGSSGAAGTAGASGGAGGGAQGGSSQGGAAGGSEAGAAGSPPLTPAAEDDGCGCSVPGKSSSGAGILLAALALVSARIRRRTRSV